jgi:hypothetical protein
LLTSNSPPKRAATALAAPRQWRAAASASARRAYGRRAAVLLAVACAVLGLSSPRPAQADSLAESEIKAAFMYNFAKFVQWPPAAFGQPQSPLSLCVIGEDAFGPALDTIDHKLAQGHELHVRRRVHLEDAKSCHILFVAESEHARLPAVLRAVSGGSVLTISEIDRFAELGGVIGLYKDDNNIRFSINLEQAQAALLQINSQLLKLAKIVGRRAREDGQ